MTDSDFYAAVGLALGGLVLAVVLVIDAVASMFRRPPPAPGAWSKFVGRGELPRAKHASPQVLDTAALVQTLKRNPSESADGNTPRASGEAPR